ncbi:EAL domain-containing protein [Luteimonas sp. XNQY3]|nr:EAL domain-containing protein [Luteimonas sp. XNQY3]MCD9008083.1 EAL domain-containing protein [Luteimonas sp. XNQY3]
MHQFEGMAPDNESLRLAVLREYAAFEKHTEPEFDRLVNLAARLFDVPVVLISLVERDRQVFKAQVGLALCETAREVSFCAHAILSDDVMVVPNALEDPRFASNPLVLGPPFIHFYAGKPLVTPDGLRLGTVCVIDTRPRADFDAQARSHLSDIAALVMERMELARLERVRSVSQARFENIAATSPDAIVCMTDRGEVTFWNTAAEHLFGHSTREMLGHSICRIVPKSWRSDFYAMLEGLRAGQALTLGGTTLVKTCLRRDGSEFPAELSLSSWREGNARSVGVIVRDVTERRRNEARLYRLASIDALTELPNRAALRACMDEQIAAGNAVTVLMLDMDGFKEVNDALGHSAGDTVLREVARRLRSDHGNALKVGRLGGDEFLVLLAGDAPAAAERVARALVRSLGLPYDLPGHAFDIGASIGVAMWPTHGQRAEDVLGAADLALYRAKAEGKGRHVVFEPAFRDVAVARRRFEQELRHAFETGEFEVFYQPQVCAGDGRICGAEALLRWRHPDRGLLTPASFIDVLGRKAIAGAVGEWVMRTACLQARVWRDRVPGFRMGVNLFEAQVRFGHLPSTVTRILGETGLPADALELELLETTMMRNDESTLDMLRELRALGVGLAFDDYGTGFASLSMLKRFPVSRLKIDRSFVRDVGDPEDAAIIKAVIYLAQSFNIEVIAEGVETQAQLAFLKENGCRQAQGYLFSPAVDADAFTALLDADPGVWCVSQDG